MQETFDIRAYLEQTEPKAEARAKKKGVVKTLSFFQRITDTERAEFFTQLSVMLQARVPLHKALEILKVQTKNEKMEEVIERLFTEIQKGTSFSKALAKQPQIFDELMIVTVEVGQESGMLGEVMGNLAEHLDKMNALKKKFVQALTYPVLVLAVAFFAVGFLLVFIVPTFAEMFRSFQMELPWSTELVLEISNLATSYGHILALGVLFVIIFMRSAMIKPATKDMLERLIIKLPIFGRVVLQNYIARFCRTLGTQLKAQVSLVDALETTLRIITNADLKSEIAQIVQQVKRGRAVADQVIESKLFPPMVAQMITVGEETSELDEMLLKVAEYYEKEIDGRVEQLSSLIEPVIVLVLGLLVAGILIAMYLPMFELVNVVGG